MGVMLYLIEKKVGSANEGKRGLVDLSRSNKMPFFFVFSYHMLSYLFFRLAR